jgi:hypothetical protein
VGTWVNIRLALWDVLGTFKDKTTFFSSRETGLSLYLNRFHIAYAKCPWHGHMLSHPQKLQQGHDRVRVMTMRDKDGRDKRKISMDLAEKLFRKP